MSMFIPKEQRATLTCKQCKKELPITEFVKKGRNKNTGLLQYSSRCKLCHAEHIKGHKSYAKMSRPKKQKMVDQRQLIADVKCACAVCGYNRCKKALDLHHINSDEKEHGIAEMVGSLNFSLDEIKVELSKCIVLCSNCHREHHDGLLDVSDYPRIDLEQIVRGTE